MLYQLSNVTLTLGSATVLSHISFEIHGTEKIALVGRNGAGKTSLLRLIAGELKADRDDKQSALAVTTSRKITIGMLNQLNFSDLQKTVEDEILDACPCHDLYARERFDFEQEYDTLFTGLGFSKADKRKKLSDFSGGEQTKIGLIRLLLLRPDILLLDEPTNHLDMETCEWLEQYLRQYEKAVVMVSHDRFFLDQTADVVYELSGRKLTRYPGNYTNYRQQKLKHIRLQTKAYERQQEEIARLEGLIERFKHKPNKAAFARSKRKVIERMEKIERPEADEAHIFTGEIIPLIPGSKWVLEAEHLKIGYDRPLLEISTRIKKGQKVGILGPNGAGKTTFLKTIAGFIPPVSGVYTLGNHITMGYFDQHTADIVSEKTVLEHFHTLFPSMTKKDARSALGAYLFSGKDVGKTVSALSGGEKSRLILAELLQSRPNFLILDEPTNHMDIQARETLESAFCAYQGTILFISHDRYFSKQVADAILIFEHQAVMYYPFGYEHYLEKKLKAFSGLADKTIAAQMKAEEQALIAGMKAVPKAERHRLKEISTEEAYLDWQLRLADEKLRRVISAISELDAQLKQLHETWISSEAFWRGDSWPVQKVYNQLQLDYEAAASEWTRLCLEWFDIASDSKGLWI